MAGYLAFFFFFVEPRFTEAGSFHANSGTTQKQRSTTALQFKARVLRLESSVEIELVQTRNP